MPPDWHWLTRDGVVLLASTTRQCLRASFPHPSPAQTHQRITIQCVHFTLCNPHIHPFSAQSFYAAGNPSVTEYSRGNTHTEKKIKQNKQSIIYTFDPLRHDWSPCIYFFLAIILSHTTIIKTFGVPDLVAGFYLVAATQRGKINCLYWACCIVIIIIVNIIIIITVVLIIIGDSETTTKLFDSVPIVITRSFTSIDGSRILSYSLGHQSSTAFRRNKNKIVEWRFKKITIPRSNQQHSATFFYD